MHEIEPFYLWRDMYNAAVDERSPFYGRQYSEMQYTKAIYNFYIHPQWDFIGSSTVYAKILFADYEKQFCIIELIGEWNDAVHNDIMEMKRGLIDPLIGEGINKFIVITENILNFHASDELYYEEWYDDVKEDGGWIAFINLRDHIVEEMQKARIHHYISFGERFNDILWRKVKPQHLPALVEDLILRELI